MSTKSTTLLTPLASALTCLTWLFSALIMLLCVKWINQHLVCRYQWRLPQSSLKSWRPDLTPRFLFNVIFAWKATSLIEHGYKMFKHTTFRLIRAEGEVIVLPLSLLEELATLPPAVASPNAALEHDLLGPFTGCDLILESRMHHTVVGRKLTPRLPTVVPKLEEALSIAFKGHFTESNEWVTFEPYQTISKLSAILASKVMVGSEFCDDPNWLDISINYTESLFRTVVILRLFPTWLRSVVCYFLPSYWHGKRYVKRGQEVLVPKITSLLAQYDSGDWPPPDFNEDPNVLTWLVESARGKDRNPMILAHIQVLLALASVHTSLLRMVNVLYDLASQPSLVDELREEIQKEQSCPDGWSASSYAKLEKLDSVLRESQRLSPPSLLGMKRLFLRPHTFIDGTFVPQGAYVCMPVYSIQNDPHHTTDPSKFDGLRAYRQRQAILKPELDLKQKLQSEHESKKPVNDPNYLFSSPDRTTLHFGYGRFACPGRHFASVAIKMLLVKVLSENDFQFLPNQRRPRNLMLHEFLFSWPWTKMKIRRRKHYLSPF